MYPCFEATSTPRHGELTKKHPDNEGRSFIEMSAYFYRITQRHIQGASNPLAPVKENYLQHVGQEKHFIPSSVRGLLEKYPTFGREKETGLLGALDT